MDGWERQGWREEGEHFISSQKVPSGTLSAPGPFNSKKLVPLYLCPTCWIENQGKSAPREMSNQGSGLHFLFSGMLTKQEKTETDMIKRLSLSVVLWWRGQKWDWINFYSLKQGLESRSIILFKKKKIMKFDVFFTCLLGRKITSGTQINAIRDICHQRNICGDEKEKIQSS